MGVWVWSGYSSFLSDDSKRCIRFWICPKLRDRQWNVCMPCDGLEVIYCLASCYVVTPEAPVGIKWVKQWMDARISTPVVLTRRTGTLTFCSFFSSLPEVSVWGEYHIQCRYHSYTTLHRMWANLFVLWRWKCFIEISVINLHSCLWGEVNFWLDPRTKWQKQSKAWHSASVWCFNHCLALKMWHTVSVVMQQQTARAASDAVVTLKLLQTEWKWQPLCHHAWGSRNHQDPGRSGNEMWEEKPGTADRANLRVMKVTSSSTSCLSGCCHSHTVLQASLETLTLSWTFKAKSRTCLQATDKEDTQWKAGRKKRRA